MNVSINPWLGAFVVLVTSGCLSREPRWPEPSQGRMGAGEAVSDSLAGSVEAQPVCVGSRKWSAGTLGDTVLYRAERTGKQIRVGYFVYWSTERPWGDNVLSYTLLPALAVDAVYSHFLFVFPGVKDLVHGPGDVEGATVVFDRRRDGTLEPVGGVADDGSHDAVALSREDLRDSRGRVVLLTSVWSHQLGEHGGAALADGGKVTLRCFVHESLRPLTPAVATRFRLGTERVALRAQPAWPARDPGPPREVAPPSSRPERVAARSGPATVLPISTVGQTALE